MKTFKHITKVGALLAFALNLFPGAWLLAHTDLGHEPIAIILGLVLLSNAIFMGLLLWVLSEHLRAGS